MTYQEIIDSEPRIPLLATVAMAMDLPEELVLISAAAAWYMYLVGTEDDKAWTKDKKAFDIVIGIIKGEGDTKHKVFSILVELYKEYPCSA